MLGVLRSRLAGMFAVPASPVGNVVKSSAVARDRLAIILAHQRSATTPVGADGILSGVDMKALQLELLDCVKRHIREADRSSIQITVRQDGNLDIFEMSVPLQ
jgi:septum formation topological specificity factor MinE